MPAKQRALHIDLKMLGFRLRRGHDLRRTFITLAQVDGARRDLLASITHGPRGDIVSVYTSFPWPGLCAEVQKLMIELRAPLVLDGDARELATTRRVARNPCGKNAPQRVSKVCQTARNRVRTLPHRRRSREPPHRRAPSGGEAVASSKPRPSGGQCSEEYGPLLRARAPRGDLRLVRDRSPAYDPHRVTRYATLGISAPALTPDTRRRRAGVLTRTPVAGLPPQSRR
jgi:hypothetical protein